MSQYLDYFSTHWQTRKKPTKCDHCNLKRKLKEFKTREEHLLPYKKYYCSKCDKIWKDLYSASLKYSIQSIPKGRK